jgi:hypothetical protein
MPKDEEDEKNKPEKEDDEESEPETQVIEEAPTQTRRLGLEEIMPTMGDSETGGLENTQWIRVGGQEEEKKEETPIYDLEKAIAGNYSETQDYSTIGTGGDYDSIQRAGQTTPMMQDSNQQDGGIPMNQAKSYETSNEQDLKERRKRENW